MIRWDHLGARDYAREQEERDGRWYADRMRLHSCPRCGQGYHGYELDAHLAVCRGATATATALDAGTSAEYLSHEESCPPEEEEKK